MKKLICTLATLLTAATLHAAPASAESVEDLLVAMRAESMVSSMNNTMEKMMRQKASETVNYQKLSPKQKQILEEGMVRSYQIMTEGVSWSKMKPIHIRIYQEHFSQEEVEAITAFYKSSAGAALVQRLPVVTSQIMQSVAPSMQSVNERFLAHMKQLASDVQAAKDDGATSNTQGPEQIVTIAHIGPMTGAIAHLGKDNEAGARLAIEELNATGVKIGGSKATLRLMAEDDAANPEVAVRAAQRIVDAKVSGVIGHLNSGTSIPASRLYSDAGIVQISAASTNPKFTRQGFKTTFRLLADDTRLGARMARYAVQTLGGKTFAVIDDRTAYGQGIAEEFARAVGNSGGNIVVREYSSSTSTDFGSILSRVLKANPDTIFYGGMDSAAGPLLKQMQMLGISAKVLGGDGICSNELAKLAGNAISNEQVYCAEAGGIEQSAMPEYEQFKAKFKSRFQADVQVYAPYTYDAVKVMVAAMVKAGSSDPMKYQPHLATMSSYKGVTGNISFDERGDIQGGAITVKTIRDGKLTDLEIIR